MNRFKSISSNSQPIYRKVAEQIKECLGINNSVEIWVRKISKVENLQMEKEKMIEIYQPVWK